MPPTRRRFRTGVVEPPQKIEPTRRLVATPTRRPDRIQRPPRQVEPTSFNFEALAWLAVALVAIGSRLINLDGNPLQPSESSLALDSWRIVGGLSGTIGPSPLLIYGNVMVFLALGASDAAARALPFVSGTFVALSPMLLRQYIGRLGALTAALALAISPTLMFGSRTVESTALTLALSVALLSAVLGFASTGRSSFAYVGGVLIPPLLISGPSAATVTIIALGYVATTARAHLIRRAALAGSPESPLDESALPIWLPDSWRAQLSADTLRRIGLIMVIEYAVLATGLGTNLPGLGDAIALPLAVWGGSLGQISAKSIGLLPIVIAGYEPLIFGFGIAGAIQAFRLNRGFDKFLVWWAMASTLVIAVGDGLHPLWIGLAIVPLGLLSGHAVEDLWTAFGGIEQRRRLLIYGAVALTLLATTIIAASNATVTDPAVPRLAFLAPLLAIAAFTLGFGIYYDARTALTSAAAVAFVATLGITVHAAMGLNSGGMLNPAEVFVETATSLDVRTMSSEISTIMGELHIARQLEGKPVIETIEIAAPFGDPIAWYLRDFPGVQVVDSIGDSPAIAVVGLQTRAPTGTYVGNTFQLFMSAARPGLAPIDLGKWWLYRQVPSAGDTYVKVFVKTQLGRP
jgi:predicted membrane-bound mannosyltransferase